MHNFTDRATGSGGETTSLGAENSQFSRTFYTNQLTQIHWLYDRDARMKPRNAIKGLKKPFSNLSDSQFIENDRLDPILSFSINWESDRLEKGFYKPFIVFLHFILASLSHSQFVLTGLCKNSWTSIVFSSRTRHFFPDCVAQSVNLCILTIILCELTIASSPSFY